MNKSRKLLKEIRNRFAIDTTNKQVVIRADGSTLLDWMKRTDKLINQKRKN